MEGLERSKQELIVILFINPYQQVEWLSDGDTTWIFENEFLLAFTCLS